jgi:hypothetical protein
MDHLEEVAREHLADIYALYERFAENAPVMLFDIQEQRIYAYPYSEFRKELSIRSQSSLKAQYEQSQRENQMVVFVRDNDRRRLVSFSWPL